MIEGLTNGDSLPVLERLMQFAGTRHRLLTDSIANFDTPGYRPIDLDVSQFQAQLGEAIDARRSDGGNGGGPLEMEDTSQINFYDDRIEVSPDHPHHNILFHDRNDRDVERTVQDMVENFMAFRAAAELMASRLELLNTAIRERI